MLSLMPAPSPAGSTSPPRVDLRRIRVGADGATAPLVGAPGRARLTIEPTLQKTAQRLLAGANPLSGSIILAHARSGRVLVWSERERGGTRPGSVLLDRRAPAASLFKLVTSAALLEKSRIAPEMRVCIRGGTRGIERRHLDPPKPGTDIHCAPFSQALGHSRNAAFAQLATRHLLRSDLEEIATRFGFNQPLPFVTPLPMGTLKLPYNDLEFARAAAGFRGSTLSPLGALSLAFTVAANGQSVRPRIVAESGAYHAPKRRSILGRVVSPTTALRLRQMMEVTIHSGTSLDVFTTEHGRSYLGSLHVAGKTGTLQPTPTAPTTTWFVGFAPSRNPRVVVSVLVQNAPVWRRKANEVARDMLRAYFAAHDYRGITHPFRGRSR
jgi:cell division protein FtsI/penicillin-binding protein 2